MPATSDESAEELTAEDHVRTHRRFAGQGEFVLGGYWVAFKGHPFQTYAYGSTLEEVWNNALVQLITNRLKK